MYYHHYTIEVLSINIKFIEKWEDGILSLSTYFELNLD